jgi:nitroimidazol reductase NimA-like FMN-containing flavoprotein (pyridoxamine 5'-phosphate oxidase superfamily)
MADHNSVTMDDDERDAALASASTGVISFSTDVDEPPHSIPVSFGYDPVESVFYFRLAAGDDRAKGELAARNVSFVVHHRDEETGDWGSVVASGQLERTTDEEIATATLEGLQRVTIPYVDIFGEPPSEVEFAFYRLVPDRLTGRRETTTSL